MAPTSFHKTSLETIRFLCIASLTIQSTGAFKVTNIDRCKNSRLKPSGFSSTSRVCALPNKDVTSTESNGPVSVNTAQDAVTSSRRNFISQTSAMALTPLLMAASNPSTAQAETTASPPPPTKVLVLGATGFVGSRVVAQLRSLGIATVGTSRDGRDGTEALNFSNESDIAGRVRDLVTGNGCTAVVSCVGSISGTPKDLEVNGGTGLAADGAKKALGEGRFVYVSVAPEVRDSAGGLEFLRSYMEGKAFSEEAVLRNFGSGSGQSSATLIRPTFIFGGDVFALTPPRVASWYGEKIESLLSSPPARFAASVTPGIISVALEPPVSVDDVASAAVAGVLGYSVSDLDTHDKIVEASKFVKDWASKRS